MRQSQFDARSIYDNAVALMLANDLNITHARLTQSFLRTEILCATSATQFTVPLVVTNNSNTTIRQSEKRLNLQDLFVMSELFIGTLIAPSATGTTNKLYTYEAPAAFTTANASTSLLQLYNGTFQVLNDGINIFPAWDIQRNYKVQRTQQASNVYYSGATPVTTLDSLDGSDDGFVPVEPNLLINGGGNMQATINLAGALTAVQANSYFVVIMRGILAQNVTSVK